jgi:hypothetical protein
LVQLAAGARLDAEVPPAIPNGNGANALLPPHDDVENRQLQVGFMQSRIVDAYNANEGALLTVLIGKCDHKRASKMLRFCLTLVGWCLVFMKRPGWTRSLPKRFVAGSRAGVRHASPSRLDMHNLCRHILRGDDCS